MWIIPTALGLREGHGHQTKIPIFDSIDSLVGREDKKKRGDGKK